MNWGHGNALCKGHHLYICWKTDLWETLREDIPASLTILSKSTLWNLSVSTTWQDQKKKKEKENRFACISSFKKKSKQAIKKKFCKSAGKVVWKPSFCSVNLKKYVAKLSSALYYHELAPSSFFLLNVLAMVVNM